MPFGAALSSGLVASEGPYPNRMQYEAIHPLQVRMAPVQELGGQWKKLARFLPAVDASAPENDA
jgi:hypothetical protein